MSGPAGLPRRSFFRSRSFLVLAIIIGVLALLWIASEIIIPPIAAGYAKREIQKRYPDATGVVVSVKAFPALKLAFRKYDRLNIRVGSVLLQGVQFTTIDLRSTGWPLGDFRAVIGQDELARFFSLKHSYVIEPVMTITPSGINVAGKVDVGIGRVTVDSIGGLECPDGRRIFFRPAEVRVSGTSLPEQAVALVRQVMDRDPVFVVREDLPYTISSVKTDEGRVVLSGGVDLEKALNIHL